MYYTSLCWKKSQPRQQLSHLQLSHLYELLADTCMVYLSSFFFLPWGSPSTHFLPQWVSFIAARVYIWPIHGLYLWPIPHHRRCLFNFLLPLFLYDGAYSSRIKIYPQISLQSFMRLLLTRLEHTPIPHVIVMPAFTAMVYSFTSSKNVAFLIH